MNNTNIENIKIVKNPAFYVDPAFYTEDSDEDIPMTPEEEAKFIENIDTEALDNILEELEKEIDNPNAWVSWEDAKKRLRRYD